MSVTPFFAHVSTSAGLITGSVRDVRMLDAHAGAEELQAAARPRGFDLRRPELRALAELLRDDGRKRVHGRGAD
jgi:hypothetical protein